ncbi:MAG TPA: iron-sulfur cluster carrier protein MrpORP [Syntrophales bacterium]|nr:iron-sulfur cluster carrier protein MrpORP [Syntrophales bacterium]HPQ42621.1 iron-sulfur cluster carrier protein MrpORP [Syntrophales bacterium]
MSEEKNTTPQGLETVAENKRIKEAQEQQALDNRLSRIRHKIMVLSGKGGVGKSTVAANIAVSLAMEGNKVGLLDTDFHGPSIPTLLNLEGRRPSSNGTEILPVEFSDGLKVMSIGFLIPNQDDAVIWRGPMKMGVIKQLITEVNWGDLDYMIIDFPPGTGDEPLSVAQLIPGADGAVIVTTPQNLSLNDVRKCINFCRQVNVPVLGVVENMSGLVCPHCNGVIDIFKAGGGKAMADQMDVPFLGRIPIDPQIVEASDNGTPFVYLHGETEAAKAFAQVVQPLLQMNNKTEQETTTIVSKKEEENGMCKIAVPIVEGHLSAHFGHCEEFAIFDVDLATKKIVGQEKIPAPPHEPGLLPRWLGEKGVNVIIAGGMGARAQELFAERGIAVSTGAPAAAPEEIVLSYMNSTLELGDNTCDH